AILVANPKTESGKERMKLMTETTDGFVLSEADLKMRGSGEIFGTRQSGLPEFQVANIIDDYPILEEARRLASQITAEANWQENPSWSILAQHLDMKNELD
ncbi:TPA: DNA helicase RecG, partial [Streptococcus suis]